MIRSVDLLAPFRWLRSVLAEVEASPTQVLFVGVLGLIFVVAPIRFLGSTTPEFRSLVVTAIGWLIGLVVVALVALVVRRLAR